MSNFFTHQAAGSLTATHGCFHALIGLTGEVTRSLERFSSPLRFVSVGTDSFTCR